MFGCYFFFFFKQKTADKIRISDGSSDVCSSDLPSDGDSLCLREIRRARGLKRRPFFGPSVWSDRGRVRDSGRYSRRGRIEDAKRLSVGLYTRHCECARVVRRALLCCSSMQYRAVKLTFGLMYLGDFADAKGTFQHYWSMETRRDGKSMSVSI